MMLEGKFFEKKRFRRSLLFSKFKKNEFTNNFIIFFFNNVLFVKFVCFICSKMVLRYDLNRYFDEMCVDDDDGILVDLGYVGLMNLNVFIVDLINIVLEDIMLKKLLLSKINLIFG